MIATENTRITLYVVVNKNVLTFRLIEMDEALETLDAAIEYKNESIQNRQHNLRKSVLFSQVMYVQPFSAASSLQYLHVFDSLQQLAGLYSSNT